MAEKIPSLPNLSDQEKLQKVSKGPVDLVIDLTKCHDDDEKIGLMDPAHLVIDITSDNEQTKIDTSPTGPSDPPSTSR